jgi:hypothetical protein
MLLPVTAIPLYTNPNPYNAKLTGTFYGERFCEKMKRSVMHKNERSKMFPRAAFC